MTRVQPEGPASKVLQPGDKIIQVICQNITHRLSISSRFIRIFLIDDNICLFLQANGYSFVNIDHGNAVSLLKTFPSTVDMTIIRDVQA